MTTHGSQAHPTRLIARFAHLARLVHVRSIRACGRLALAATPSLGALTVFAGAVATASVLVACEDESDPKTWVKRLDDKTQRAVAVKKLTDFFNTALNKHSNNRDDPEVKALLDQIIEPLSKAYVAGDLDDKTRKDLMQLLADTHDPRTAPALAKALADFEMGKTDDDVRMACQSITQLGKAGKMTDQAVIDGLWNVFSKFQLSKATSERLYKAVHDAVVAVHDPSYGPKAVAMLSTDVKQEKDGSIPDDEAKDKLSFWQTTAIQVIGEMKYTAGIKPMVIALLTGAKQSLNGTLNAAFLRMPKESEAELVKALTLSDPDYAKLKDKNKDSTFKDKLNAALAADSLSVIGRTVGRDAIIAALNGADTDTMKTGLAQSLVKFPNSKEAIAAFQRAYNSVGVSANVDIIAPLKPRPALAQAAAQFYDSSLVDWLVGEMAAGSKTSQDIRAQSVMLPLESATKLMTPQQKGSVKGALDRAGKDIPKDAAPQTQQIFDFSAEVLDKCGQDVSCYINYLDQTIPSNPPTSNSRQVKSCYMIVIYGGGAKANDTRAQLVSRVGKVKDASARLALVQAIDKLAPNGDAAAADALDKVVEDDRAAGDQRMAGADDAVAKVAQRLRARAQ